MKAWPLFALVLSCGSTGSDRFDFEARASGITPATFTNAGGWNITLTKASFTIGPIYFAPQAGRETDRYVGEVLDEVAVDPLSPSLVSFPSAGTMTEDHVRSAEIWLSPCEFAGVATRGDEHRSFAERIVLDDTLAARRVRGIPAAFFPQRGGHLEIRVDARVLFAGADFDNPDQVRQTAIAGLRATATYEVQWLENR